MTHVDEVSAANSEISSVVDTLLDEFSATRQQLEQAIRLLDEENTIWFIARYRKEQTGGLDEGTLQRLDERLKALRTLQARRAEVIRLLEEQGQLTDALRQAVEEAPTLQRLEDIYRPYRPKRRTRAGVAREKGLVPLARMVVGLWRPGDWPRFTSLEDVARHALPAFEGVESAEEAWQGAQDLVAQWASDDPHLREAGRKWLARSGRIVVEAAKKDEEGDVEPTEFDDYFGFEAPLARIKPHQVLALDRGEREGVLRVRIEADEEAFIRQMVAHVASGNIVDEAKLNDESTLSSAANPADDALFGSGGRRGANKARPAQGELRKSLAALREEAIADGFRRLLWPALQREARSELTRSAHEHAIHVFGSNLRELLLQPPIEPAVVMGIDPGYRAGCKVAVVSPTGDLLETATVYPHPPQRQWELSVNRLVDLVKRCGVQVIAVGNGTASYESQLLAAEVIRRVEDERGVERDVKRDAARDAKGVRKANGVRYVVVDEAGASVYSASPLAREEFPDIDVTLRSAVSIARRLQDPLAELVKIDPKSIGVGMYQHDVDQGRLAESLEQVVASCVNNVGVELNTASAELLRRVSGLSARQAAAIVDHRRSIGRFTRRSQLLKVAGIGPKTFEQCAGFLRIAGGEEPLDNTAVHPESYPVATRLLQRVVGTGSEALVKEAAAVREGLAKEDLTALAREWAVGLPTLEDIAEALRRPGRDPRSEAPPPLFRTEPLQLEDVRPGMRFEGRVTNVVDFGAFVDIGLEKAGLVHLSQLSDRYVSHPFEVVSVGDRVQVVVVSVDVARGRIGLSMRAETGFDGNR